jgi:hypothetical protein
MTKVPRLAKHLFPFQNHCVGFALESGCAGLFLSTGLGKTACELEWALHASAESNGKALILTPLAVARQIEREGLRWGYPVRVIRENSEAAEGINICNYDRLERLNPEDFGAVVLDESSILKNFTGKTTQALTAAFAQHRWKLAATATPAPNDHMELGTQAEFLSVMPMADMLIRWFTHDSGDTKQWRLKGYAVESYWNWMASWCRMADHPRDLGDSVEGYDLPPLKVIHHQADASEVKQDGALFATVNATSIYDVKRQTAESRSKSASQIATVEEPWLIWCDTDNEQGMLESAFKDKCLSVRGSQTADEKESRIVRWLDGEKPIMISKPSILGFGLNFQFCAKQIFVGRTFSYETWYQAVRRSWRFGQSRQVEIHVIVAEGEDAIGQVIDRKSDDHQKMKAQMSEAMRRAIQTHSKQKVAYEPKYKGRLPSWLSV